MFTYSKLAQGGIAAVSYLAEKRDDERLIGSGEIAESRQLSRVLVAKILTLLSAGGLVTGKSGPNGGYQLARDPGMISLFDVIQVFEDMENQVMCPFGPNWCGIKSHCPLHDTFTALREDALNRLKLENFSQFCRPEGKGEKKKK